MGEGERTRGRKLMIWEEKTSRKRESEEREETRGEEEENGKERRKGSVKVR